ncbi:MAG: hypothetical protein K0R69_634 [Clostridia bacterium]|jgi:hypothetical protein|nr:hypothetical protein [Clostridia bacterium]
MGSYNEADDTVRGESSDCRGNGHRPNRECERALAFVKAVQKALDEFYNDDDDCDWCKKHCCHRPK